MHLTIYFKHVLFDFNTVPVTSYLFLLHPPLAWGQQAYGYYTGFSSGMQGLCNLVFVPLLKNKFQVRDMVLIISSIVSSILSNVWFGLCNVYWMPFLGRLQLSPCFDITHKAIFTH